MNVLITFISIGAVLGVYGIINYYIARKIYQFISVIFSLNTNLYIGAFIFLSILLILGFIRSFLPVPIVIKNIFSFISSYWMGIIVYLLMFFLISDLIIFLGIKTKIISSPISQSIQLYKGMTVILLTILVVGYGIYNANQIKHVSYDIKLKENRLTSEIKLVMISDLHLGAVNSEKNLDKVIEEINALNPDIVCIVGDIFNDDFKAINNPDRASNLLKNIKSAYGVYGVLGNHDGGKTYNDMKGFLEKSNIKLLNDEYEVIDEKFIIFGRVDGTPIGGFDKLVRKDPKDVKKIIDSLNPNIPLIVMDHNPTNVSQYGNEVDLILGGHSHKGQIFPANLITKAIYIVDYGHYQKSDESSHIVITSGVGTWSMPMRIATNNEIVTITLK